MEVMRAEQVSRSLRACGQREVKSLSREHGDAGEIAKAFHLLGQ